MTTATILSTSPLGTSRVQFNDRDYMVTLHDDSLRGLRRKVIPTGKSSQGHPIASYWREVNLRSSEAFDVAQATRRALR